MHITTQGLGVGSMRGGVMRRGGGLGVGSMRSKVMTREGNSEEGTSVEASYIV